MIADKVKQEALTITMEECAELQVEAAKIIRFGSDTAENIHKLEVEIGDLMCMIDLLDQYKLIDLEEVVEHKAAKREKLKLWSDLIDL